jgi:hypothetical protein
MQAIRHMQQDWQFDLVVQGLMHIDSSLGSRSYSAQQLLAVLST